VSNDTPPAVPRFIPYAPSDVQRYRLCISTISRNAPSSRWERSDQVLLECAGSNATDTFRVRHKEALLHSESTSSLRSRRSLKLLLRFAQGAAAGESPSVSDHRLVPVGQVRNEVADMVLLDAVGASLAKDRCLNSRLHSSREARKRTRFCISSAVHFARRRSSFRIRSPTGYRCCVPNTSPACSCPASMN